MKEYKAIISSSGSDYAEKNYTRKQFFFDICVFGLKRFLQYTICVVVLMFFALTIISVLETKLYGARQPLEKYEHPVPVTYSTDYYYNPSSGSDLR